jgi:hypothetical protein
VEARVLEDALDALAHAPFPINPHLLPTEARQAIIEFPAYTSQLDRLNRVITAHGMDSRKLEVRNMLDALHRGAA